MRRTLPYIVCVLLLAMALPVIACSPSNPSHPVLPPKTIEISPEEAQAAYQEELARQQRERELQAKRLDFISEAIRLGIFYKVEKPGKYAQVWVSPKFYGLTYDDKSTVVNVVWAYYLSRDSESNLVMLADGLTGKEIGKYGEVYGGLRMN